MKLALLAAVLLVTAACGAYQFPGQAPSPTPSTGVVSGRVIAGPCAPVEEPGTTCPGGAIPCPAVAQQSANDCAGRPVPSLEIDYLSGVDVVARTVTNADGSYTIDLQPGAYTVRMKTYMRVVSGPLKLTVSAGSHIVANYLLDTGIRIPVPQQ